MTELLYEIECYDEEVFKTQYQAIYDCVVKKANMHGIDLSKYYFSQYVKYYFSSAKDKIYEEIYYILIEDEDVSLCIEYHDYIFQRCELTRY